MSYVNIVTSDTGWILEKLATEISTRLPYVRHSDTCDPKADIQYYVTYSTWRARLSPIEVAYFAHLEQDQATRDLFFQVAGRVDFCVCHSEIYEQILRGNGVATVTTIPPGVDIDTFKPTVKIGVVGRTYHTGRKGEALVRQVMDVPGIKWHFTGEGWPGPALNIPGSKLPDFYNEMDYILVPALYEGGPMCVVEALACGTPVIAPPIGWVPKFPHIEFKTGDANDLRRVLEGVVAERNKLRESAAGHTWDNWAEGHDRLFRELLKKAGLSPALAPERIRFGRVALLQHGSESKSLGGPTVRIPRTASELRQRGVPALRIQFPDPAVLQADLLHGFNVWSLHSALSMARRARSLDKPFVFSPIFLDLSEKELWESRIPDFVSNATDDSFIEESVLAYRENNQEREQPAEAAPGQHAMVREMISAADHVIFLSEYEKFSLKRIGATANAASIVRNPIDADRFGAASSDLFVSKYGLKDFVLCLARIEPRKNQLMLLCALRNSGLPIVLIGHSTDEAYLQTIKPYLGPTVHLLGRIDPNSDIIPSACAAARVFVLPSFAEGAPLAALEAGAAGASLVLSNQSGEREYFGDQARYCDPYNASSIRSAVLEAFESKRSKTEREAQKARIADEFSWSWHIDATLDVYRKTIEVFKPRVAESLSPATKKKQPILFDLTTSAGHKGRWTGISRVETALARALLQRQDREIIFTIWDDKSRGFFRVPPEWLKPELLSAFRKSASQHAELLEDVPEDCCFVVGGSAWMQNSKYASSVAHFAVSNGLRLSLILHDLIPIQFPFWFNEEYAPVFRKNLTQLLRASSNIIAVSNNTKRDTELCALEEGIFLPPVSVIREGDDNLFCEPAAPNSLDDIDARAKAILANPFVLSVGAIHTRKNHRLLHDVWVKLVESLGEKCPRLVIVGGVAWNGRDVERGLKEDRRISRYIHILDDVSDSFLKQLYNSCLLTVYPSLYEGWGLPVAESLVEGKICIASSESSVPEIAPDCTDLLDPVAVSDWADRIQMYAMSRSARSQREEEIKSLYKPYRWSETTNTLIKSLDSNVAVPVRWKYTPGTIERFNNGSKFPEALGKGWHAPDAWGVWAAAAPATLRLEVQTSHETAAVLVLVAQALASKSKPVICDVTINGHVIGRLTFRDTKQRLYSLHVPRDVCAGATVFDIYLSSRQLVKVCDATSNNKDERQVGIGLAAVALAAPAPLFRPSLYALEIGKALIGLEPGQSVDFLGRDDFESFFDGPVCKSQEWGIYDTGPLLRLTLPVNNPPQEDLHVTVVWRGVAAPENPLNVLVLANGKLVAQWNIGNSEVRENEIIIPTSLRNIRQPIEIDFVAAPVGSPESLGIGSLSEAVSLGLFEVVIEADRKTLPAEIIPYKLGTKLRFDYPSLCSESSVRFLDGWLNKRSGGRRTRASSAAVALRLDAPSSSDMMLSVSCSVPRGEDGSVWSIRVAANGREIARSRVSPRRNTTILAAIPAAALQAKEELILQFHVQGGGPSAISKVFPTSLELLSLQLSQLPSEEFGAAVAFGDAYRDVQMWAEASEHYARAVTARPEAAGYHVQLGHMLKESGRGADAERSYIRARELEPQDAEVVFQLGHLMKKQGDARRAYIYYKQASHMAPNSDDIRNHLQWATEELGGQTPEGSSANGIVLEKLPSADSVETEMARFLELGNEHASRGNWSLAVESYERACLSAPDNAELWWKLGEAQLRSGLPVQAAISQRQAKIIQHGHNEPKENGAALGPRALRRAWQGLFSQAQET